MDVRGFTIDGPTSRDLDDAIWVDASARGWTVTICIANVADAIAIDSNFDESAKRRVETSYFAHDKNRPMIPRRFSEGSCSLVEGERRSVMGIRIHLDHTLEPQGLPKIETATLVSKKRLSYCDVPKIAKDPKHELHRVLENAASLTSALMQGRRKSGAFVLYDLNTGWVTNEEGYLRRLKDVSDTMGYIIIQELMILANKELARFCAEVEIPVPYRNHTARAAAPERAKLMERLDVGMESPIPDLDVMRKQFNLVMNKADYGTGIEGHFGLNLPAYTHCTSPIRRYADLIAQRQILAHTRGQKLPYTHEQITQLCDHINSTLMAKAENETEAAIERANRQAQNAIRKQDIERLSAKEFSRVIKVAARSGKDNRFVTESLRDKLKNSEASAIDIHTVLFESDWDDIKDDIVDFMIQNPHVGTSICNIASQVNGWGEPKFKVSTHGDKSEMRHTAAVHYKKKNIESPRVTSRNLKTAKQVANVFALCVGLDLELPEWEDAAIKEVKKRASDIPPMDDENPIGRLSEYCQALGQKLPHYTFDKTGKTHEPRFLATCKALGIVVSSTSQPTKKLAKKEAALHAIAMLHELQNEKTI